MKPMVGWGSSRPCVNGSGPNLKERGHIGNLVANGFTIKNRKFESTLEIDRDDIADDRLGVFKPMFSEMGQAARPVY
jgi:phage major head subunit gpT-like protein